MRPPRAVALPDVTGTTAQLTGAYASFYEAVASQQLAQWLPAQPANIVDLSGTQGHYAAAIAADGHTVVHMTGAQERPPAPARGVHSVRADVHDLGWLRAGAYDAVLAESSALSACLAFEESLHHIAAALRPGGSLLISVDSLMLGLARLAEQGRWAELADVPAADVVLVPDAGGTVSRCFWPEELAAMLSGAGMSVDWIRPRTVLAPDAVNAALDSDPGRLQMLVETELRLEREREGETMGYHLVAAAVRR